MSITFLMIPGLFAALGLLCVLLANFSFSLIPDMEKQDNIPEKNYLVGPEMTSYFLPRSYYREGEEYAKTH